MSDVEMADKVFSTQRELIVKIKKAGDIVAGDDGYYIYFPSVVGGLSEWMMRAIADELELMNQDWNAVMMKFDQNEDDEQLALGI